MRKKIMIILTIVWIIAFVRMIVIYEDVDDNANIVTAFSNDKFVYTNSLLKAEASIGSEYFTEEERKEYLEKVASAIGLTKEYDIDIVRDGDTITAILSKQAKSAYTSIKMVTNETQKDDNIILLKNYLYINIEISNSLDSAVSYQEKLKEVFKEMSIVADISLILKGHIKGELNNTEKNNITDKIMQDLGAEVVTGNREDSLYTVYGYCEKIDDYIMLGSTKTNVNIAITYDEGKDMTNIYMATPIINEDF
ncbi:MAG: YwmB family TATA-box binding protein [Lachnospiraceae bacterium]|nr:YwmB family TATA-box binding protein [Lachnospiraceae bacterium]